MSTFDGRRHRRGCPERCAPPPRRPAAAAEGELRHPAVAGRGERPRADGRAGLRLRPRPGPAHSRGGSSAPPRRKKEKKKAQAGEGQGPGEAAGAAGAGRVADRVGHRRHPAVIASAFDEAERRDQHKREWTVLIDGNNTQSRPSPPRPPAAASHHDHHRLHPRARVPLEGRLVLLRQGGPAAENGSPPRPARP